MKAQTIDFRSFIQGQQKREQRIGTSHSQLFALGFVPPNIFHMPDIVKECYLFVIGFGIVLLSASKLHDRLKENGKEGMASELYTFVTWSLKVGYKLGLVWLANEFRKSLL